MVSDTQVTTMVRAKKAVIFDLFHTLTSVESTWGAGLPSTSELLGVDRKAWNEQLLAKSRERLTGEKTDPYAIIADMAHAIDPSIPEDRIRIALENRARRFVAAVTDIPAETIAVLETLKAQGKLLGLITNADVVEIAAWERNGIHHLFDSTVHSCRVGMVKPEGEIYRLALRELGVSAAEAVFVGDGGSDELQGARVAGMTAVLFTGIIRELWPEEVEARRSQADFVIERLGELVAREPAREPAHAGCAVGTATPRAPGEPSREPAHAGCVLLDWGNTLMVDFPQYSGPMASWPRVEALPHARETLVQVRALGWLTALATNAGDSGESDIRAALARVELDGLIDRVYCSRDIGHAKPSPDFFAFIKKDLGLPDDALVMVGDSYVNDIEAANRCGIRAVWFRAGREPDTAGRSRAVSGSAAWRAISDLAELPAVLRTTRA